MSGELKFDNIHGRDLDLEVAKHILGWTQCVPTGYDYDWKQHPNIFGPRPDYASGLSLPPKWAIPLMWLVPEFSSRMNLALELCRIVKLNIPAQSLPTKVEDIVRLCVEKKVTEAKV